MDAVTIGLFLSLEAALLLAVAVVLLRRRQNSLRRQLDQMARQGESAPAFASVASGYLPYLEQEILDTRAWLEDPQLETAPENGVVEALASRLALLEKEKKVAELCNDYPERRWEHIRACFSPLIEQAADAESGPDGDPQGELAEARKRIESLEKFREHFFAVKRQLRELEETRQKLMDQLETLLPEAERSEELQVLLAELSEQKRRLQEDLEALESGAEATEAGVASTQDAEQQGGARHIHALQEALGGQETSIQVLQHLLLQAREQPDENLIEEMEKQIAQLERQCREANTCVEIMEQENERLQHKVDRVGLRAERAEADGHDSRVELQQQLDTQTQTITELQELVESLKLEAEQAQALREKIEQLERAGRDMSMCVETLEEENEFLQDQVRALLQLDESQTLYHRDDEGSDAAAQQELEQLQEEIRAREEKLKALEEKFAAMEQEYLTLYEEANS